MPTMREALGFSTVGLAWVVNAYMLAYGGLLFLGGRVISQRTTGLTGMAPYALDPANAERLWEMSLRAMNGR